MGKKGVDVFVSKFALQMGFGMIGSWLAFLIILDFPGWLPLSLAAISFSASWVFGVRSKE